MKLYQTTNNAAKPNEYLKITTGFEEGGPNLFNGKRNSKGLYVYFNIVERKIENGWASESFMMFNDNAFKVLAQPLARRNTKKLDNLNNWVNNYQGDLFKLYAADDREGLLNFITAHGGF